MFAPSDRRTTRVTASSRRLILLALAAANGCADDTVSEPIGSISLSASPPVITVPQGGSATVSLTLVRSGFSGLVSVSVAGLPGRVTTTVTPAQLTLTNVQADVRVDVASTVATGTYTGAISAVASGRTSASATFTLVVTELPAFTLSPNPAVISIHQGATGSAGIQISRTNFASPVSLALVGPPNGISGSFAPASTAGDSATLTVNAASTVAPGTYALTVTGSATGMADRTTTVTLNVTQPPDYALLAPSAPVVIVAGSTGQVIVDINRTNFTGAVSLSLVGPPPGVTGTFSPMPSTGATSALTVSVAATVAAGTYTLNIAGSATAGDRATTVSLIVNEPVAPPPPPPPSPPSAPPDFALSASPVTISQGNLQSVEITISRTNFSGPVSLQLQHAPTGISGTFNQSPTTGSISTLTLTALETAPPGVYSVTIVGSAPGLSDRTTTIQVTVVAQSTFWMTVTPRDFNSSRGATHTATVTVFRINWPSEVVLSIYFTSPGLSAALSAPVLNGTTVTATLTINVGANAPLGRNWVGVRATTGGTDEDWAIDVIVGSTNGSLQVSQFQEKLSGAIDCSACRRLISAPKNILTRSRGAAEDATPNFNVPLCAPVCPPCAPVFHAFSGP